MSAATFESVVAGTLAEESQRQLGRAKRAAIWAVAVIAASVPR